MTDNVTQAQAVKPRYLLMKRDLYYRPDNRGYTGIRDKAGRYFETDALPDCGVTAIHEDDAPEFSKACFDDLARDHLQEKVAAQAAEIARLREALEGVMPYTVTSISCNGDKCRLPVCRSCNCDDEDVAAEIIEASSAIRAARAALTAQPDDQGVGK